MGGLIAFIGALLIIVALILVRYRYVSGNSKTFALLQALGSLLLLVSMFWQFNLGTLFLQLFVIAIMVHSMYLNSRKKDGDS